MSLVRYLPRSSKDYRYSNNLTVYTLAASRLMTRIIMKRNDLIFLYRFPLMGDDVTTPRRQIYMPQRRLMIGGLTGLSGTVGSRDQFNYGVNLSYQHQGNETTAGAVATVNGSYSQSYLSRLEPVFQGHVAWSGGVNLTVFPKRLL